MDWTKFEVVEHDNLHVAEKVISSYDMVENIEGKEENAGYQHFLLLQQFFHKTSSIGPLKVGIVL